MAMPETRIGFIPDVGSTGWLYAKCPPGYPEFLGLTGYEMRGAECVRLGFATHLADAARIDALIGHFSKIMPAPAARKESARALAQSIAEFTGPGVPSNPDMDFWVREYFAGKDSLPGIMSELRACGTQHALCEGVFQRLSERSPTALLLTHRLLRHNEGKPLEEVFRAEHKAAVYITKHPDYREGVRARIIDRDDNPRWTPARIEDARLDNLEL
jgi:enoyl-CoA hydratase/carnithine racemase